MAVWEKESFLKYYFPFPPELCFSHQGSEQDDLLTITTTKIILAVAINCASITREDTLC